MDDRVPPPIEAAPLNRARTGVAAASVDVLCGSILLVMPGGLGPDAAGAVFMVAMVTSATAARLYGAAGQPTWPVRLTAALVVAAVAAGAALSALGREVTVPAILLHATAVAALAASWRVANGVWYRRRRRAHRASAGPDLLLVPQGESISSMSAGAWRVWQYRHLVRNLVARHAELKYRGSVLGFAWTLIVPLLTVGVYSLAFTRVMKVGTPRFVLYLIVGVLAWNYFSGAMRAAVEAVVGASPLIRSVVFPRVVLPLALVLFQLGQFALSLAVFLPIALLAYGAPPLTGLLVFPVFLLLHTTFILGLSLALATATASFRDVRHLVDAALGMLFWATPVVYEIGMVPGAASRAVGLSPVGAYIRAYQDIFYYGTMPEPALWLAAVAYAICALACGLSLFQAHEGRFAELV